MTPNISQDKFSPLPSFSTGTNSCHPDKVIGLPSSAHASMVFCRSHLANYRAGTNPTLTMDLAKNHSSARQTATTHTANR
jgi:hypothetical protein